MTQYSKLRHHRHRHGRSSSSSSGGSGNNNNNNNSVNSAIPRKYLRGRGAVKQ